MGNHVTISRPRNSLTTSRPHHHRDWPTHTNTARTIYIRKKEGSLLEFGFEVWPLLVLLLIIGGGGSFLAVLAVGPSSAVRVPSFLQ